MKVALFDVSFWHFSQDEWIAGLAILEPWWQSNEAGLTVPQFVLQHCQSSRDRSDQCDRGGTPSWHRGLGTCDFLIRTFSSA